MFEIEGIDWAYPKDWGSQVYSQVHSLYKAGYRAKDETWGAVIRGNTKFEMVDLVPELLNLWDTNVARISRGDSGALGLGVIELEFAQISEVVNALVRSSGWKQRNVLSMLKANNRCKRYKDGVRYWSNRCKSGGVNVHPEGAFTTSFTQ